MRPAARDLERIELLAKRDLASTRAATDAGAGVVEVAGASIIHLPPAPQPFTVGVLGLGLDRPVKPEELDELLDAAARLGDPFAVALSPRARPSNLLESLLARGLSDGYAWMKFSRDTVAPPPVALAPSARVERAGPDEAAAFAAVVREVYSMPVSIEPVLASLLARPKWTCLLGWDGDTPVAAGALYVDGDLGWLGFGATRASHRRLGFQGALLAARVRLARGLGARALTVETGQRVAGKPDASYKNLLRCGFEEAYLRPNLIGAVRTASAKGRVECAR